MSGQVAVDGDLADGVELDALPGVDADRAAVGDDNRAAIDNGTARIPDHGAERHAGTAALGQRRGLRILQEEWRQPQRHRGRGIAAGTCGKAACSELIDRHGRRDAGAGRHHNAEAGIDVIVGKSRTEERGTETRRRCDSDRLS